jgi:hypothetical protein
LYYVAALTAATLSGTYTFVELRQRCGEVSIFPCVGRALGAIEPKGAGQDEQAGAVAHKVVAQQVVLADLAGMWRGEYTYLSQKNRAPVQFVMSLQVYANSCRGRIEEPNTFGNPTAARLYANVECQVVTGIHSPRLLLRKTYDGTGGVSHSIDYVGDVSPDHRMVSGTWNIRTDFGRFSVARQ